jgi:hypothetical protein
MAAVLGKSDLLSALKSQTMADGLHVIEENDGGYRAEEESILSKWFLGQRKVVYRMSVRLAEADHVANFREMVKEVSSGLQPPSLTVETTSVKGWERSGTREERTPAGGGRVDFGKVREGVKSAVDTAGWTFHLEGGQAP